MFRAAVRAPATKVRCWFQSPAVSALPQQGDSEAKHPRLRPENIIFTLIFWISTSPQTSPARVRQLSWTRNRGRPRMRAAECEKMYTYHYVVKGYSNAKFRQVNPVFCLKSHIQFGIFHCT